ncbi:MAG: PorP/SprF family type IX secretion system membrane protein [Bacteroidales bacterium]|nr:PorP/SprF family type IX secretion system membrane protein [Bacteroidales bacterium]
MRNIIFGLKACLLLLVFSTIEIKAQEPYYSQYYNTPLFYNPAMVGLSEGLKVRLMYHNQWPQYSDDLKSYNFSMDVAERFMPGAGGLGIIFNTNKEGQGFIRRNMVGGLGSVRVRMSRNIASQFGFMASFVQKQIDSDDYIWSDQLEHRHGLLYPQSSFSGFSNKNISYPDLSIGGVINYEKQYISMTFGAAVHHLFKPNESFYDMDVRLPRKYVAHADFVIFQVSDAKKGFRYNPGILYENQAGFHTFTLGANVAKSVLYAGAWYRNKQSQIYNYQSLVLMTGINIPMVNRFSRMKLMYSYDISITQMTGTGGTHEITLRFEFDQIHLVKSQSAFANDYPIIFDPVVF